jgi:hypothetical protein
MHAEAYTALTVPRGLTRWRSSCISQQERVARAPRPRPCRASHCTHRSRLLPRANLCKRHRQHVLRLPRHPRPPPAVPQVPAVRPERTRTSSSSTSTETLLPVTFWKYSTSSRGLQSRSVRFASRILMGTPLRHRGAGGRGSSIRGVVGSRSGECACGRLARRLGGP